MIFADEKRKAELFCTGGLGSLDLEESHCEGGERSGKPDSVCFCNDEKVNVGAGFEGVEGDAVGEVDGFDEGKLGEESFSFFDEGEK